MLQNKEAGINRGTFWTGVITVLVAVSTITWNTHINSDSRIRALEVEMGTLKTLVAEYKTDLNSLVVDSRENTKALIAIDKRLNAEEIKVNLRNKWKSE